MLNVYSDSKPICFLGKILHLLETYNLMPYLHLWQRVSISPHTENGNRLLTVEFSNMKGHAFLLPQKKSLLLSLP